MNRFKLHGGCPALPVFSYIVPKGAKSYDEWLIDTSMTPIVQRLMEMLLEDPNCEAVADWLNLRVSPSVAIVGATSGTER